MNEEPDVTPSEPEPNHQLPVNKFDSATWLEKSELFMGDGRQYASIATQTVALAMNRHSGPIKLGMKFATTIEEDLAAAHVYATLANFYMDGAKYCLLRHQQAIYDTPGYYDGFKDEGLFTESPTISDEEILKEASEASDFEG